MQLLYQHQPSLILTLLVLLVQKTHEVDADSQV